MRPLCPSGGAIRDIWLGHHAGIKAAIDLRVDFTKDPTLQNYSRHVIYDLLCTLFFSIMVLNRKCIPLLRTE